MDRKDFPMDFFANMPPFPSRMFRFPQKMEGDSSKNDDVSQFVNHKIDNGPMDNKKTISQLKEEMHLTQMGFNQDTPIEWSKFELPQKTDLHKLLRYRITHYINPDVLVKIGNYEYRCHLLVLQCYSQFFSEKTRIELPETSVTKQAFANIYDWMLHLGGDSYTLLRRDNVLEILVAAQYLKIKELEEQCWAFINDEDLFCEDKAFMLYLDARNLGNTTVMQLMVPRIQRFFLTLVSSKDFLELSPEEMAVILRSNYICIHCEIEIFMSGVRWLMYDWEKRQKYLVEIMSCVRFSLISPWQLIDIQRNPLNQEFLLVTKDRDVAHMIEDGLAFAICKYWYGHDSMEYNRSVETLRLKEPAERNWAGTSNINDQKKYNTYQEFLLDLSKYRHMHMLSHKTNEEQVLGSSESVRSDLRRARKPKNTGDFIMPEP